MKSVRVNVEEFDQELAKALAQESTVFVLFFGTEKPGTSESWCPDCVIADPLIRKAIVTHAPNSILIEAPVGHLNEWRGNAQHPYRTRSDITIPAIPTLYKWSQNGPGSRLVEEECADTTKLEAFVKDA